jgi:AraC-like DNA-binding protein
MNTLACLMKETSGLTFEPYFAGGLVDEKGRYRWDPTPDFPFAITLLCFSKRQAERPLTWHEYLELFIPLDSHCRFRVGANVVDLRAGDVLVMDNLKLHVVLDFAEPRLRAIVIRFLPDFVYGFGSFSIDHLFCMPFYHQIQDQSHVLRRTDAATPHVHAALSQLLKCYFDKVGLPYSRAGTKAFFLEVLYHIARHFHVSEVLHSEYLRQQQLSLQLRKLFDYTSRHAAEKITVDQAAAIVGMSRNCFMKAVKAVAGMTWVDYVNQVRLNNGAQLLRETRLSIAEISTRVGFTDQSYFDRRFKERFAQTPLRFRTGALREGHRHADR